MSFPEGTYLGGIRSLKDLMDRCHVDRHTGCWHWRLARDPRGIPKVHFVAPDTGKRMHQRGRRASLYLKRGRDVPKGHRTWAKAAFCRSLDCVNPDHSRSGSSAVTFRRNGASRFRHIGAS